MIQKGVELHHYFPFSNKNNYSTIRGNTLSGKSVPANFNGSRKTKRMCEI